MSFEADFLSMTADTITVHAPSTMNRYGGMAPSTSSAGVTYPAHIDMTPRQVVSQRGVEEVAAGTVYILSSSAVVGLQHVIELPDGTRPVILRAEPLRDEEGQHHVEVTFK